MVNASSVPLRGGRFRIESRGPCHSDAAAGSFPKTSLTQKTPGAPAKSCQPSAEICQAASHPGGVDKQTVNAIFFDKESNPIVIRFDDGVVFNVDIHQGNHRLPNPALQLAGSLPKLIAQYE